MWFDILKWEEILKRKIFEEPVPKWLEGYAEMKDSDSVEIEGFRVFGHAMKRMMGYDVSNDPRPLDGAFYFMNMLRRFQNTLNMRYKFFDRLKDGYQFSVIANGYVWAVRKNSEDDYDIVSYIGKERNIKSKKKQFDLGLVDSDGAETARSREELIADKSVNLPIEEDDYDPIRVREAIEQDPTLKYYDVPLDKLIERLTAFNNYEDLMEMLDASIKQEDRDRIKMPLRRIKDIISDIKKAEVIYTEATLKEAGGVSFAGGANIALFGDKAIVRRKKRGKKRKEEH